MSLVRCCLTLASLFAASSVSRGDPASEFLERARKRNRQAVESIHTMYCRYITTTTRPNAPAIVHAGECWYSSGSLRIKWSSGGQSGDVVLSGGRILTLVTVTDPIGKWRLHGSVVADAGMPVGSMDVRYESMMLVTAVRNEARSLTFFDDSIAERKLLGANIDADGGLSIEMEASGKLRGKSVYDFDPKSSYWIKRILSEVKDPSGKKLSATLKVEQMKEPAPGLFFPSRISAESREDGAVTSSRTTELTQIAINQPLPPGIFDLRFEAGTVVDDQIAGKRYTSDGRGSAKGKPEDLKSPPPPVADELPRGPTRGKPVSWTQWLLPSSLILLTTALFLIALRRLRERREAQLQSSE